jgi:hypothetical protein
MVEIPVEPLAISVTGYGIWAPGPQFPGPAAAVGDLVVMVPSVDPLFGEIER